jgi:hypothetical protein
VLTAILAPLALVLALIGVVLAAVGLRMARRPGVTGRGVAVGGMVLSVLTLFLSAALVVGVTTVLNDDRAVDRLEREVERLRDQLPQDVDVPTP